MERLVVFFKIRNVRIISTIAMVWRVVNRSWNISGLRNIIQQVRNNEWIKITFYENTFSRDKFALTWKVANASLDFYPVIRHQEKRFSTSFQSTVSSVLSPLLSFSSSFRDLCTLSFTRLRSPRNRSLLGSIDEELRYRMLYVCFLDTLLFILQFDSEPIWINIVRERIVICIRIVSESIRPP